jgi:hypothetical protein
MAPSTADVERDQKYAADLVAIGAEITVWDPGDAAQVIERPEDVEARAGALYGAGRDSRPFVNGRER